MLAPEDKDSILARYFAGPAALDRALAGITDAELDARSPTGGWTIRQTVHHIVDGDDLWKTCIKMALGNEQATFSLEWYQGQPQEAWADSWAYERRSTDESLALLRANRHHVNQLLSLVPEGWQRSVSWQKFNGDIERMPIGAVIEMQADHLEHHVRQIAHIRSSLAADDE